MMNYKAQLLHIKAQRKQSKHVLSTPEDHNNRNIDVFSQLIDHQLDHITIKVG